jgi:beta-phosphoglucomutase-like phosphatase (HAD superfamily)
VPAQIRHKLELTGLLTYFGDNLFSATMVARGKPAPDLFLYAAEQLSAAPTRCLVIEDSAAGIDAAIAARMTAIGFSGGSHCGPAHAARTAANWSSRICANCRLPWRGSPKSSAPRSKPNPKTAAIP